MAECNLAAMSRFEVCVDLSDLLFLPSLQHDLKRCPALCKQCGRMEGLRRAVRHIEAAPTRVACGAPMHPCSRCCSLAEHLLFNSQPALQGCHLLGTCSMIICCKLFRCR